MFTSRKRNQRTYRDFADAPRFKYCSRKYTPCSVSKYGVPHLSFAMMQGMPQKAAAVEWVRSTRGSSMTTGSSKRYSSRHDSLTSCTDGGGASATRVVHASRVP